MAEAVLRRLDEEGVLLVEAGTGTGKTLAYLLAAAISGKKVVVSTGTKNLQDQIMEHDLPLVSRILGADVQSACMKGLANYLCLRRFEEYRGSDAGLAPDVAFDAIVRWSRRTATGDRAELGELAEDLAVWGDVSSSVETRIGSKCDHFEACFVTRMRREAERARIVVVNHHLFFADLAAGGGVLPEHDAVIVDEAHLVEDVATSFFGTRVSARSVKMLARDARRALVTAGLLSRTGAGDAAVLLREVEGAGAAFFEALPPTEGRTHLDRAEWDGRLGEPYARLDDALDGLAAYLRTVVAKSEAIAVGARRARTVREELGRISDGSGRAWVAWTEGRGARGAVGGSPVDLSEMLRERFFYRTPHVVLTSATLTVGGRFDFVRERLGIDFDVDEVALSSPFDYPSQALLYVPKHLPEPRDGAFADAVADEAAALVEIVGGGAFVLCTSLRNMRAVHARLEARLPRRPLLQGERPRHALLEAFRRDGDAVLVATASFWQGVDVPGRALRLVVIDKLPFEVPTDPIVAARTRAMEEDGRSPFVEYHVPAAALALKQGFGRLIRTRRDRGIVAVCDRRIVTRGYGRRFLDALPPAARATGIEEVVRFWRGAQTPAEATA
jgi:ATP-dependent DNA helicase DinG